MSDRKFTYQPRIVIYLDVLGFENELSEFEKEGLSRSLDLRTSKKANRFINVFQDAIGLINSRDCKSYLFTDNICLTFDPDNDKSLWIEIFFTISDLFLKFAEIGYFLRGGVDYGYMLDQEDIAVGIPLVNSYKLERDKAIFPRILVSDEFVKSLDLLIKNNDLDEAQIFYRDHFLIDSCELTYVNPFFNIIKYADKIRFFKKFRRSISVNLKASMKEEKIFVKYKWLAEEFNKFLTQYIDNIDVIDQNIEMNPDEKHKLKEKLKGLVIIYD